ncbi:MAG: hypothetical protein CMH57_02815 [Myxococcales bacterium]|nr:hypothetical protein [Myxococcales bacterium]
MPDPTLSLGISQDEVLISVLVGLISWFLTWLIGKLGDRLGGRAETIRHWLPEISLALAVGGVAAWRYYDVQDVWSLQTLVLGLSAFAMAIGSHSGLREKVKIKQKKQGNQGDEGSPPTSTPRNTAVALAAAVALLMAMPGCQTTTAYPRLATSLLSASQTVSQGARVDAAREGDTVRCATAAALEGAFGAAEQALLVYLADAPDVWLLPAIEVDMSSCSNGASLELLPDEAAAQVSSALDTFAPSVFVVTRAVMGSAGLGCEDTLIASAVLSYLEGATAPLVAWLTSSGAPVAIGAVKVDLRACR